MIKKLIVYTATIAMTLITAYVTVCPVFSQMTITNLRFFKTNDKSKSYMLKNITPLVPQSEINTKSTSTLPESNTEKIEEPEIKPNINFTSSRPPDNTNNATTGRLPTKTLMKNWNYKTSAGDYYQGVLENLASSGIKKDSARNYRFTSFPIKFWISPTTASRTLQIKMVLKEVSNYFPLAEAKQKEDAQLIVEILGDNTILEGCPQANTDNFGCGGLEVINNNSFGYVKLLSKTFNLSNTDGLILHELGHAFGIAGHSQEENDLMYLNAAKSQFDNKIGSVSTKKSVEKEEANNFSARDLNTLYKIYSQ